MSAGSALPRLFTRLESAPEAQPLAIREGLPGFTIYLDGHEGHQGNVLANAFLTKATKLILVLNRLERAFIGAPRRQTDFEIIDADKTNPTTLSLKPVPRVLSYNPTPAMEWGIQQMHIVARGEEPDERVGSDVAFDLHDLATKKHEEGYRSFWINGYAEAVKFDNEFAGKALRIARSRLAREAPQSWKVGAALGTVTGELKAVDDLEEGHQFVIVPAVGPNRITCTFPDEMREEMGEHLFKIVRVHGTLQYGEKSPFPFLVRASKIERVEKRRKTFAQMRGIFAERRPVRMEWGSLQRNGQ